MACDVLVVLQNAWFEDGRRRDRREWLAGLWASHTGRRLEKMLPQGVRVEVINASTEVGAEASSSFPADLVHIRRRIETYEPRVVLGCGKIACDALAEMGVEHVRAPHPAWRALTTTRVIAVNVEISSELARAACARWTAEKALKETQAFIDYVGDNAIV